jgi:hypothetical protein
MPIQYVDSGSFNNLQVTGSTVMSGSNGVVLQLKGQNNTIFSISGSSGELFSISDVGGSSVSLFSVLSNSANILDVKDTKQVNVSGSLIVTGSLNALNITGSLFGTASYVSGSVFTTNNPALSASFSSTSSYINPLMQDVSITGSLSVSGSSFSVIGGTTEFQVQSTGIKMGNTGSDFHQITGSVNLSTQAELQIACDSNTNVSGSFRVGTGDNGYVYIRPSSLSNNTTSSKLEFVNRADAGSRSIMSGDSRGVYNLRIENFLNESRINVGRFQTSLSLGFQDTPYSIAITRPGNSAGVLPNIVIGTTESTRLQEPSASGYILLVTGSSTSGSFSVNNDIKVMGSGIQMSSSLAVSASVFMPSLTASATTVNQVVMRSSSTGQLFVTASSAIGGGGTGAVNSVDASGGGISVSPTTGNVLVSNTGVHSLQVADGYPISVSPTTGQCQISTSYHQLSQIFDISGNAVSVRYTPINNTGDTFTWQAGGSIGEFILTADNYTPFTANRTFIQVCLGTNGRQVFVNHYYVSTSQINIYIYDDTGTGIDDGMTYATIDIKIFP